MSSPYSTESIVKPELAQHAIANGHVTIPKVIQLPFRTCLSAVVLDLAGCIEYIGDLRRFECRLGDLEDDWRTAGEGERLRRRSTADAGPSSDSTSPWRKGALARESGIVGGENKRVDPAKMR